MIAGLEMKEVSDTLSEKTIDAVVRQLIQQVGEIQALEKNKL